MSRRLLILILAGVLAGPASVALAAHPGGHLGFQLERAKVRPHEAMFDGKRAIKLRYSFEANRRTDLKIRVVARRKNRTVAVFRERDARPGKRLTRRWNGVTRRGKAAPDGRYEFRVGPRGRTDRFAGGFRLHGHSFPVDGPHGTRGAIGDFGAPRNGGRTHEGFDITADCGTPLVVARGGKVRKAGYDPRLYGYYVLVNGRKTNEQYFYAHLIAPSPLRKGDRVKTGERVGNVGQTGNAASTPCHLHFEVHVKGRPVDPEPRLRRWDRYS